MGNQKSTTSLLLRQHFGIGRKMRKAQSSSVLSEFGAREESEITNSPSDDVSNDPHQRHLNGGAYIKKQRQGKRKQSHGVEGRMMGRGGTGTAQKRLEKRGSSRSNSGDSQDGGAITMADELAKNVKSPNWLTKQRKGSSSSEFLLAMNQTAEQKKRIRSTSICTAQMKAADCQAIANLSYQHALAGDGLKNGRKGSSSAHGGGVMPPLMRLRIQQCFRNAKSAIGSQILKRASALRPEFKSFVGHLREEKADELANDIFSLITECVANIEFPSKVAATSFAFGEMHAQLCQMGFRPEYFSVIADATIAECLRLDAGAQKRCETLLAWSQLMQFMFSNVRDGYYAEVRQQRRSSLPLQRLLLKQVSIAKPQEDGKAQRAETNAVPASAAPKGMEEGVAPISSSLVNDRRKAAFPDYPHPTPSSSSSASLPFPLMDVVFQ
uniref:Globin family profile domain-containing protein n=1 Tax=Globodera rostochiensis TaxID=31243 RepID=A0A914HQ44_GLORO